MHSAQLPDGRTLKLTGPRILVEVLPGPKKLGVIELPDNVAASNYSHGKVLAVGVRQLRDGRSIPLEGVRPGDRCVFVRFVANIHTNEQVQDRLGENIIIVEPKDLLLVYEAGVEVEVD